MIKKRIINLFTLLILILLFTTCDKEDICETCTFVYPDSGSHGLNILNIPDTVYISDRGPQYGDGAYCSMKATLPTINSKLRVTIEGKRVVVYNNQGWSTNAIFDRYDNYVFQAEGQIIPDLRIHFCDSGEATIKIYEDDLESYSRIKVITLK